jgi:hypothetical protein
VLPAKVRSVLPTPPSVERRPRRRRAATPPSVEGDLAERLSGDPRADDGPGGAAHGRVDAGPDGVGVSAIVASASMSPSGSLGRPQHLAAGGFVALGEHEVASAADSSGPTGGGISMSSRLSPARAR